MLGTSRSLARKYTYIAATPGWWHINSLSCCLYLPGQEQADTFATVRCADRNPTVV